MEHVVLIHGLLRTHFSMLRLERRLRAAGYVTHNQTWPLRTNSIRACGGALGAMVEEVIEKDHPERVHFVGHSLGGLVVRAFLNNAPVPVQSRLGRAVLIGTPNNGSAVAWKLQRQLGAAIPVLRELASPECIRGFCGERLPIETLIIEGTSTAGINPVSWLSRAWFGEARNDGVVSGAEVAMECDNVSMARLRENHTFLPLNSEVVEKTVQFLQSGAARQAYA
jgi:pimeloyl-ACP methyl ester carboxylesterase